LPGGRVTRAGSIVLPPKKSCQAYIPLADLDQVDQQPDVNFHSLLRDVEPLVNRQLLLSAF
jgi:hypothetical protein